MDYDFSGWATKANIRCSDGRIIMKDAFKQNDGKTVPLVWNHNHDDPNDVLGHALLENRSEGVYAYCKFNDTETGQTAKQLVKNGDVVSLSIYANQLKHNKANVVHGNIRELSLVLAGANPEACIDSIIMHGEESDEEALIYTGEGIYLIHSEDNMEENKKKDVSNEEETVADVFNTLTDKQKTVVYAIIGEALKEYEDNEEDNGGKEMKHNIFENDAYQSDVISHSDQNEILAMAKTSNVGSFQAALACYMEQNDLQHDAISGFSAYGEGNVTTLFPDYKDVRPGAPEVVSNDQGWISVVMSKVHKSPISRIRTRQVDIRGIEELRAKGYKKGDRKKVTGNLNLVRRTTDPQTVYVKNALNRDDITDITDFDYVQYLYNIDRMMLNEELATAIMIGDNRDIGDEDKIQQDKIRPIWLDDDLYTLHVDIDIEAAKNELQGTGTGTSFGENYVVAEAMINSVLYAREKFKGSGTPDMFITPHMLNVMLLARDMNGRRIYSSVSELASSLNVGQIYTVEQFEGKTRTTDDAKTKKLIALIANLNDYSLGATKGGEVTHFTQFDIDFNQQKSLLETRCSGALTRISSAIAIEEDITE